MSIQMVNAGNPRARQEIIERFKGLLLAVDAMYMAGDKGEGEQDGTEEKATEEVKCFFFALVGSYPTGEELREMTAG